MAVIDLGNIRINWRGAYQAEATYVPDDAVSHRGSSYIALRDVMDVIPVVGEDWDLLAAGTDQLLEEGDILIHDGNAPVRLARGAETEILQLINGKPAWRTQAVDPSRRVAKLAKVNGMGGSGVRAYLMADGTIKACGIGSNNSNGDPTGSHVYIPSRLTPTDCNARFVEVFLGGAQNYALTANGEVWSWGYNNYGQLGHGDTANRAIATRIEFFVANNIQIAKVIPSRPNYYDYACALFLTTDGKVYGCGFNGTGQLGNGTTANQYVPVRCGSLTNITCVTLSGMQHHAYAVEDNGNLWVWGSNNNGQLGLGDGTTRQTPILHPSLNNIVKAVASAGYTTAGNGPAGCGLVLRADGTIWTTGYNGYGQLGLGDTTDRTSFTQIIHPAFFTDIFAGDGRYPAFGAISQQKEIYLWGYNGYGQIGNGNTANVAAPFKPAGAFQGNVTRAVMGGGVSTDGCVLQAGNQLWSTGYNGNGNLGIGHASNVSTFQKVLGISGTIQDWNLYGNGYTAWGISVLYDDGRVDACGENSVGACGTQPANLHNVLSLTNVIF
ncbi:RCC1 domain-containing protein [Micavibrio aeruginosavorus]|uniref:Alpha-tubulin suppressor-related RCC1 domain-containing protein n=1 Tax=Micavibrio aeruginosavorus EPB TaxID=349215 RepID=M4VLE2_9BACT|nr:alpha-tubulin suppressor [Micavibrio aeruginosavorus]AGH98936.1 Alpha-tubulin suppressor-related RCC1 domain-containing protein [Micavibrio aeruginosavorus EPB]